MKGRGGVCGGGVKFGQLPSKSRRRRGPAQQTDTGHWESTEQHTERTHRDPHRGDTVHTHTQQQGRSDTAANRERQTDNEERRSSRREGRGLSAAPATPFPSRRRAEAAEDGCPGLAVCQEHAALPPPSTRAAHGETHTGRHHRRPPVGPFREAGGGPGGRGGGRQNTRRLCGAGRRQPGAVCSRSLFLPRAAKPEPPG